MFKNVASQKVAVFAWDTIAEVAKTGDAAQISAQISKDGAACAATNDAAPTELDATDAPGVYIFDMLQEETNADMIVVAPVSSTDNIILRPVIIYTRITEAAIKTAIEADGGDLSSLMEALVNKAIWTESDGKLEMHNDAGTSQGTIAAQITTDGTYTTRKRALI